MSLAEKMSVNDRIDGALGEILAESIVKRASLEKQAALITARQQEDSDSLARIAADIAAIDEEIETVKAERKRFEPGRSP